MIESLGPANTFQNSSSIEAQSKPATDSNPTPSEGEEKQSIVIPRDYNTISVCAILMFFSVSRMMKSRDYTLLFLKKSFNCKWTSNISKIEILPSLHNRFEKYFFDSFLNSRSWKRFIAVCLQTLQSPCRWLLLLLCYHDMNPWWRIDWMQN